MAMVSLRWATSPCEAADQTKRNRMNCKPKNENNPVGGRFAFAVTALISLIVSLGACADAETNAGGAQACPEGLEPATEYRLFFGLTDSTGEVIVEGEWQMFLDEIITPRFPGGLTVLDAYGQWQPPTGSLHSESTRVLLVGVSGNEEENTWGLLSEITAEWSRRYQGVVYHMVQGACAGIP